MSKSIPPTNMTKLLASRISRIHHLTKLILIHRRKAGPTFSGLRQCLDEEGFTPENTEVTVLDFHGNDSLRTKTHWEFQGAQDENGIESFKETLATGIGCPGIRLLVVNYQGLRHLNHNVVDALGIALDIDPHKLLYKFGYKDM